MSESDSPSHDRSFEQLPKLPSSDVLLASAVRFLIDGGEEDAASVLLSCSLSLDVHDDGWWGGKPAYVLDVTLIGPRDAYEILNKLDHEVTVQVRRAFEAVIPPDTGLGDISAQAGLVEIDPDWRTELLEIARGRGVHNQAVREAPKNWRNLRFRSESEVRIAQPLDRAGVLFLPNCMARLGVESDRKNREADFLVCAAGGDPRSRRRAVPSTVTHRSRPRARPALPRSRHPGGRALRRQPVLRAARRRRQPLPASPDLVLGDGPWSRSSAHRGMPSSWRT
jgi:hypothetical protein